MTPSQILALEAKIGLHRKLAESDPKLMRGQVWCAGCGFTQAVDSANALRNGWPWEAATREWSRHSR